MSVSLETLVQRHSSLPELDYDTLNSIPSGLLTALNTMPDPRRAQGRRYSSGWLLTIIICTLMAGRTGYHHMSSLARRLTNHHDQPIPNPSTFHRFLIQLDAPTLDTVLARWAATLPANTVAPQLAEAISIDGKELRSAKHGGGRKVHLLSACTHDTGLLLGQVDVAEKTNEITLLPEMLELLARHYDLTGRVITLDALHTQRAAAQLITGTYRAHYVFTLKGNQRTLHALVKSLPWSDVPVADTTIDTGHGRMVIRKLQVAVVAKNLLPDWPGLGQVARLTRQRTSQGKTSTEVVFVMTSLPPSVAGPAYLADLIRGHWSIENKIHHVRDTTYREDHNQIRTGHAPRNIASLTNAVLTAFRSAGLLKIRENTEAFHAQHKLIPEVLKMV